jgi:hypothetical protein
MSSNNKSTTTAKEAKMAPVGMTYYEKAQSTFKPPLIANENAFLGDISSRYAIRREHLSASLPYMID